MRPHSRRHVRILHVVVVAMLLLPAGLVTAVPVALGAGTLAVNTTIDETATNGRCSLREALQVANGGTAADCGTASSPVTITVPAGNYQLTAGSLTITGNVAISGAGVGVAIVNGSASGPVFNIAASATANLTGVTITGGGGTNGGGFYNSGTLKLSAMRVTGNSVTSVGGGIYNSDGAILNISMSTIDGNSAGSAGGGVASYSTGTTATATIDQTAIVNNGAGPSGGTAFQSNTFGGGVYNLGNSVLTIVNSTISANRAGDDGAGLYNFDGSLPGTRTNHVYLSNDTISHNASVSDAGGFDTFGPLDLHNTIIAQNTAGSSAPDCRNVIGYPIVNQGFNLIQDTTNCVNVPIMPTDKTGVDPLLGPLRDNGGPTLSRALGAGSPAINAGDPGSGLTVDQRGFQRPANGRIDIGAYEFGGQINDSWLTAKEINAAAISTETETIDLPGQSRWYKFKVTPSSKVTVQLTNLPANYDLTLYKDIGAAFGQLQATVVSSPKDLLHLGAEFAPDAFSPDAFSPDAFSPDAFSPDAFSPDAFSPDAFSPDAFSPDAFSPDAFSPDAFSPDAFSPDAFSPDAFSGAQSRSLLAVSAFESTTSEGIRANTWLSDGYFYVRVRGRNGAFNPAQAFTLQTALFSGSCANANLVLGSATPIAPPDGDGNFRTLILTDTSRFTWNTTADRTAFLSTLQSFASRADIGGQVIDFGGNAGLVTLNTQADLAVTCPFAKNLVAGAIKAVIDSRHAANLGLQYLVVAGDDNVLPFFRRPDQALIGNERDFVPPVLDNTASQASLREGYFLSQDEYAATTQVSLRSGTLPLPALAIGRLVETPAEIAAQIQLYIDRNGAILSPTSSLVTGYDFLADAAGAVQAELAAGIGHAPDTLITPRNIAPSQSWTADQLRSALLGSRHDLIFLAGHFNAGSALAADYSTRLTAAEIVASSVDLTDSIIFSAGCHAGYNLVDNASVAGVTQSPDWPQAAAQKRAILIAGTGYQYGDTDFIEYSERLYRAFSQQLRTGTGPLSIGQVLVAAKQQYLTEVPSITGLHEKALLEATLYGLPMVKVNLTGQRLQSTGSTSIVTGTTGYAAGPGAALNLQHADVNLDTTAGVTVQTKALTTPTGLLTATYLTGPQGVVTNPAQPVLPLSTSDVSLPNTVLRGVGFRGGNYTDTANILPLTGAPTTEVRGVKPPFYSDIFFPVQPYRANYLGALAGTAGDTQNPGPTQLMVTPAQYQSSSSGAMTGTLRQFSNMNFRLYYSNLTSQNSAAALAAPPAIASVADNVVDGKLTVTVTTHGASAAGIQEVWIAYTSTSGPFYGRWQPLDLAQDSLNPDLWTGTLDLQGTASGNVRYLVQAANGVGLVTMLTNQGAYYTPGGMATTAAAPTTSLTITAPASGAFGTDITVAAQLRDSGGHPQPDQPVTLAIGGQSRRVTTDSNGTASATLRLLVLPDTYSVQATFGGTATLAPSSASQAFTITKQNTSISLSAPTVQSGGMATVNATLLDALGNPLGLKTIFVTASGGQTGTAAVITDFAGRATATFSNSTANFTVTATFASGDPGQPADERYNASNASTGVAVNHPPVANVGSDQTVDEGATVTIDASGSSDPDHDTLSYAWTVTSSTGPGITLSSNSAQKPTFVATGNGVYRLQVTVSDGNGGSATDEVVITVRNAIPTVGAIGGAAAGPIAAGTSISASAPFTDAGRRDTHTATWTWGDGSTSPGTVTETNGNGTVAGGHTYTTPGVYTITLTVSDNDGGQGIATFQYVVVYDPNGGFVTGGGWITSPAGAYAPDPSLTGKATFGFNAKYQKGATVPSGQTQFQFQTAGLSFSSTSYDWLVVSGAKAQFKGSGTINGTGTYRFMLTAVDGDQLGQGKVDKFRIRIWAVNTDGSDGGLVYDNQFNAPDTAEPTTALGGGSIQVHK